MLFLRKFLKDYINNHYPGWDISIALRYLPIVTDLKKVYKEGEIIAEIGSGITGVTPYLKKLVIGVDVGFDLTKKNEYLTPVKGSALKLPFGDRSIDYVLSVDMLEHIKPVDRPGAVLEMIRSARKKIYLSFPCGSESARVDRYLADYYLKKHGHQYPYLKEHLELGLPDETEVETIFKENGRGKLKIYNNTNLKLWKLLLQLGLSGEKLQSSFYRRLLILLPILKHFNFGICYRKLFVFEIYP